MASPFMHRRCRGSQCSARMARELTRDVLDMKGAVPASMFADSPHLSRDELAELDAILNAEDSNSKNGDERQ